MALFESQNIRLNYEERGIGRPVIMLHGFGMSAKSCWMETGWFDILSAHGYRALALDSRGHGLSDKPTVASQYAADMMTADVINLLDHIGIERAHFIGHSMGARTAFDIARRFPARLTSLIGISVGSNLFEHVNSELFIRAMEGKDPAGVPAGLAHLADLLVSLGNKREALIACLAAPRPVPQPGDLRAVDKPVLMVCGDGDVIVGDPNRVVSALPRGKAIIIPNREHTDVLASREVQQLALEFLDGA